MISVIETHDLCKSYNGRIVVEHLNLSVPQGCVYGFLGPNGAGKSTSMKILLGLVHPTSGSVKLLGQTMNEENRIAEKDGKSDRVPVRLSASDST